MFFIVRKLTFKFKFKLYQPRREEKVKQDKI